MLGFVGKGEYFELYSLNHGEPVKGAKDGSDVVGFLGARDETSCCVLDSLQGGNMGIGKVDIQRITIVEVCGDKGMDKTFRIGLIQEASKFPNFAYAERG